jgi:arylsulfatase A-like enzyme
LLRAEGYHTALFGKPSLRFGQTSSFSLDQMFHQWRKITNKPYFLSEQNQSKRHVDDLITERAIDFLQNRAKDKPFSLQLFFNSSESGPKDKLPGMSYFPYPIAVSHLYRNISPQRLPLDDESLFLKLPAFLKQSHAREIYDFRWDRPAKYTLNTQALYRMISGVDAMIGRVLSELDRQGLTDNTIIIYTATCGSLRGERGLGGKWLHFDESTRVPLIIVDPRSLRKGQGIESYAMVSNLDLPATICDIAGAAVPQVYQGRSLVDFINGENPNNWRSALFCEHYRRYDTPAWNAVRHHQYLYARYTRSSKGEFLHDLKSDPHGIVNLADDQTQHDLLSRFRQETDDFMNQYLPRKEKTVAAEPPGFTQQNVNMTQ